MRLLRHHDDKIINRTFQLRHSSSLASTLQLQEPTYSRRMRVAITGKYFNKEEQRASGVLGSAIHKAFKTREPSCEIFALSNTRTGDGLVPLDLINKDVVDAKLKEFRPNWIIHCAAERRPDVAEKDPEATRRLNAEVPAHLASLAKTLGSSIVYISTDYVFDGTSPPYTPSAQTNPLNLYGQTKRDGEETVLSIDGAKAVVLRVPVLYGPAPKNSDSAVNILLDVVQDQSGKQYKMDHYATRFPTNVEDIAGFLVRLTDLKKPIPPILHYSAAEPYTKYEMCLVFAKILGLPHKHIIPDAEAPTGASAVSRPKNTQLYTKETEDLGVEGGLGLSLFEEWWTAYLKK
uniref:RmlD-like substrate binding domain-containing protein n=1 Tax=Moniliophthora roreri TaxID=221103 RepID=A0A0W0FT83_MONRR